MQKKQHQQPVNPIAEGYYRRANEFIAKSKAKDQDLPTIRQGQQEFAAWQEYFARHLGWTPRVMQMAMDDQDRSVTVPSQWPQWFDPSFEETRAA